ncbi:MAG: hypothetical protein Q4A36_03800 [Candidatus Saccharibacteria bacterium]|nr:hypothetical protein [Candidatus Saccharibacteria bacterium]
MKIFVVKDEKMQVIGYALTFGRAKKLATAYARKWFIEEQPIGRWLDPRERREAWSTDMMLGDKLVPAGTLVGPYDGSVLMIRAKGARKLM